jgi:hypothetical protein
VQSAQTKCRLARVLLFINIFQVYHYFGCAEKS